MIYCFSYVMRCAQLPYEEDRAAIDVVRADGLLQLVQYVSEGIVSLTLNAMQLLWL